jgi:hypothetical protein
VLHLFGAAPTRRLTRIFPIIHSYIARNHPIYQAAKINLVDWGYIWPFSRCRPLL